MLGVGHEASPAHPDPSGNCTGRRREDPAYHLAVAARPDAYTSYRLAIEAFSVTQALAFSGN